MAASISCALLEPNSISGSSLPDIAQSGNFVAISVWKFYSIRLFRSIGIPLMDLPPGRSVHSRIRDHPPRRNGSCPRNGNFSDTPKTFIVTDMFTQIGDVGVRKAQVLKVGHEAFQAPHRQHSIIERILPEVQLNGMFSVMPSSQ